MGKFNVKSMLNCGSYCPVMALLGIEIVASKLQITNKK